MLAVVPLNWLAIILAAVVGTIIGGFWFSPAMFGKAWTKAMGWKQEEIKRMMDRNMNASAMIAMYGKAFITTLIMAFVLSLLIHLMNAVTVTNAVELGVLVWLGFVAMIKVGDVMFEQKSFNYYLINVMYYFVNIIVMSFILAAWF